MTDLPMLIFVSVILIGFGYAAGNARSFSFWKMALLVLVLHHFGKQFGADKTHYGVMVGAFLLGYWLPYGHLLQGIGDGLSNLINAVRYRSAWEDIRRKEAEVEEMRRQYEQAKKRDQQRAYEEAQRKRQEEARQYREHKRQKTQNKEKQQEQKRKDQENQNRSKQQQQGSQQRSNQYERQNTQQQQYDPKQAVKEQYLTTLGLDPKGDYSFTDIKKAYRRQASKCHPDKYATEGKDVIDEMTRRFQELEKAFKWLTLNKN